MTNIPHPENPERCWRCNAPLPYRHEKVLDTIEVPVVPQSEVPSFTTGWHYEIVYGPCERCLV